MATFHHFNLALLNPAFDSPLVDVLTELEHLRRLQLAGTTPAPVFFQLKRVFHMLESLGSARIEGNHTTLADYVERSLEGTASAGDQLSEIANIEEAMTYIETAMQPGNDISEHFIRELHAMAVRKLVREGDATHGAYRVGQVQIAQSEHLPPDGLLVGGYMQELVAFINQPDPPKYDLIKVALAHHRFGWIHPFGNGNGRVVRLLTYALMIKYGFNVKAGGRVLNPTAVFCSDRDQYYAMLACADVGQATNLEQWCLYVLQGVLSELKKVDQLTQYDYLKSKILAPAITHARSRTLISAQEEAVLLSTVKSGVAKAADLTLAMPNMNAAQRTYQIKKLVERKMLHPIAPNARQYTLGFDNSYLMRGVIRALSQESFISAPLTGAEKT
ncbi:cell filamentation protein Fic [Limnohabitans sp. TS-CS-82]|uniref:Fic family protein n=1 Tax=Limnohabitans sp. TS-CS-82 TaxID=2094193 RepID=UPI000CF29867|nr:Fic family protein [Limnohabitans sp. TS-CS-82]PQA83028.1 cell filamentation protein Fic [Limnohabitans sp. TS-CS-82]